MASFSLSASTARTFSPTAGRRSSAGRRAARGPVRCVAAATVEKDSVSVVLLAGGVGKRMKADMPKQYLPLLGTPIALYSLKKFAEMDEVGEIVVVCDPSYRDIFEGCPVSKPVKFALPQQLKAHLISYSRRAGLRSYCGNPPTIRPGRFHSTSAMTTACKRLRVAQTSRNAGR